MASELMHPQRISELGNIEVWDDFFIFITTDMWTLAGDTTPVAAVAAATAGLSGGKLVVTSDGSDNDAAIVSMTWAPFFLTANKAMEFVARVANTDATGVVNSSFGLSSLVTNAHLADDGGGPTTATSQTSAIIYKVDGGTVWNCHSQIATTYTTTATNVTAGILATTWHTLRIKITPTSSTTFDVTYYVDTSGGVNFKQMQDANGNLIVHKITLGTPVAMSPIIFLKAGTAVAVTSNIDYIGAWQER